VRGAGLPDGIDWPRLRRFARAGRDALAHGDERLAAEGFGYRFWRAGQEVKVFGRAKGSKKWQTHSVDLDDLGAAIDALAAWLDRESSIWANGARAASSRRPSTRGE
jgi:hypothetical protein